MNEHVNLAPHTTGTDSNAQATVYISHVDNAHSVGSSGSLADLGDK